MQNKDFYNLNISELIDLLSNLQIKETKLKKDYYTKEISKVSKDIDILLKKNKTKISAKIIRKIIFVSLSNLIVWEAKDQMISDKKNYYKILKKALQINSIRNTVTNSMMKDFNEYDFTRTRVTRFTKNEPNWKNYLKKKLK